MPISPTSVHSAVFWRTSRAKGKEAQWTRRCAIVQSEQALLEAKNSQNEWPGTFASTTGLIFLGTPFRGAEGMSQMEMLAAAQREYQLEEIQPEVLKMLEPGTEFLQEIVGQFGKTRRQANRAHIACFYELKLSNVGRIVGKSDRMVG